MERTNSFGCPLEHALDQWSGMHKPTCFRLQRGSIFNTLLLWSNELLMEIFFSLRLTWLLWSSRQGIERDITATSHNLTAWSRVRLKKMISLLLLRISPAFCGN
jgi:hypothetical protein